MFASLLAFSFINFLSVHATLYVINPRSGGTCQASKPCTVEWLDDGTAPLLSDIGVCTVGLYTGQEKLVQTISPVDVSSMQSLKFTPDPKAGPDSDTYYIAFTSTTLNNTNGSGPYQEFSPAFRLTQMSGSFASPNPSDTSTKPLPSSFLLQQRMGSSGTKSSTNSSTSKHSSTSSTTSSSSSSSGSSSSSPSPTTPLVFPTPTGTVSSDNKNSASSSRAPVSLYLVSVAVMLLVSGATVLG